MDRALFWGEECIVCFLLISDIEPALFIKNELFFKNVEWINPKFRIFDFFFILIVCFCFCFECFSYNLFVNSKPHNSFSINPFFLFSNPFFFNFFQPFPHDYLHEFLPFSYIFNVSFFVTTLPRNYNDFDDGWTRCYLITAWMNYYMRVKQRSWVWLFIKLKGWLILKARELAYIGLSSAVMWPHTS